MTVVTVRELRNILDEYDGELEVIIRDSADNIYDIEKCNLEPRFKKYTENNVVPLCITVS